MNNRPIPKHFKEIWYIFEYAMTSGETPNEEGFYLVDIEEYARVAYKDIKKLHRDIIYYATKMWVDIIEGRIVFTATSRRRIRLCSKLISNIDDCDNNVLFRFSREVVEAYNGGSPFEETY